MKIYIVYVEYQADTPTLKRAFMDKAAAEAYVEALEEQYHDDGEVVWGVDDDDLDWTVTINLEEMDLQ